MARSSRLCTLCPVLGSVRTRCARWLSECSSLPSPSACLLRCSTWLMLRHPIQFRFFGSFRRSSSLLQVGCGATGTGTVHDHAIFIWRPLHWHCSGSGASLTVHAHTHTDIHTHTHTHTYTNLLLCAGEILVSATGLEFAYSQAPPTHKGSILAIYYVAIAIGNLLSAAIYSSLASVLSSAQLLLLYTGLMSAAGVLFIAAACLYVPVPSHRDSSQHRTDSEPLVLLGDTKTPNEPSAGSDDVPSGGLVA
jgi:hypothetical protein